MGTTVRRRKREPAGGGGGRAPPPPSRGSRYAGADAASPPGDGDGGGGIGVGVGGSGAGGRPGPETLWETFTSHPLVRVAPFVLIPYGLYLLYYMLTLQRPRVLTGLVSTCTMGLVNLRPALGPTDERQVLIVGLYRDETERAASALRDGLGLEVGSEASDARWNFVRDGTASWFHAVRFLEVPPTETMGRGMGAICGLGGRNREMGFHPANYRPPRSGGCGRHGWDKCWERECYLLLAQEWGCAARGDCRTPFRRSVHQARNPLRSIEALAERYCPGGPGGAVDAAFLAYASAMFPDHDFDDDSCVEAVAEFVVLYDGALIAARRRGHVDGFYRIEDGTACDAAELAGLMERGSTVYGPNRGRVAARCAVASRSSTVPIGRSGRAKVEEGRAFVRLGWKDLRGGAHGGGREEGDDHLEKRVRNLFYLLGYNPALEPEEPA